jgi:hypothetical protein
MQGITQELTTIAKMATQGMQPSDLGEALHALWMAFCALVAIAHSQLFH